MRFLLFCALTLAANAVGAGALENCLKQKQAEAEIQLCVETAELRSTNQLRKLSATTRAAVADEARNGERSGRMRAYRRMEARHVRERNSLCRKHGSPLERSACIADMNEAHGAELARFMQ
ncbi:MAG TPA: hypothetical protein DHV59_03300 [Oxalobacteraceae bacterium]|nr:hypothetical protein [Oxalobacteraceae bacterium]